MRYSFTHRATSLVLTVLMIISLFTVSAFTTLAAETDLASTEASTYYIAGTMNNWSTNKDKMTQSTDISGTTIYYAGPYNQQYEFKVTDGGTTWYGQEIKTNALYDNSLEMYEYGTSGNCWPAPSSSPYYVVFTTSSGGNAISCVTKLPISSTPPTPPTPTTPTGGTISTKSPTIYVRDASNNGFALWAWTAGGANLFSGDWATRPTSATATANADGFKAYKASAKIGLNQMYSVKVTKSSSVAVDESWFETYGQGDLWIDIDAKGKFSISNSAPNTAKTKATAFSDSLWVDTQSDEITDTADTTALVKWFEKSAGVFHLYLPSGMSLTNVPVYHSYTSLKINDTAVSNGSTYTFKEGTEYKISGDISGKLTVYQDKNVHAMYLNGSFNLPTDTSTAITKKGDVERKGGNIYTSDSKGALVVKDTVKKLKGRGNSSWEASYKLYGKYAYNLTTDSKTKNITGGNVKTKKYSMLANNADESMMRNLLIYSLADKIGIDYTPTIRVYDLYDNGNYLGSYTICEKVEVGSSGLLSGITSLDDANAEVNPAVEDAKQMTNGLTSTTPGFYKYVDSPDPEDITGGYLLEFEISERFDSEVSGFVSNKGQAVVCKYPEFATKNEIKYIMDLFNKAESAVYKSSPDINEIAKYIDVESFAKMYLIQELSKNIDAAQTSYYIYKESDLTGDGKLHAAPVWDYDWTCGQYTQTRPVSQGESKLDVTTGWTTRYRKIDNNTEKDDNLQAKLCACPDFWNLVKSVWYTNFKDTALTYVFDDSKNTLTNSTSILSTTYADIKNSLQMNETRWGFIASNPSTEWGSKDTGATPDACVDFLNDWVFDRITWMNSNIGTKAAHAKPNLVVSVTDSKGAVEKGTAAQPTKVSSDVTIKLSDADKKEMLYTLTVNEAPVYPDASGNYIIKVADTGTTEISLTATSHRASVASTDTDYITEQSATYYVTKEEKKKLIYGDSNLSGTVSISDATVIQRHLAYIETLTGDALKSADADGSGEVTIMDVTNIQRHLAYLSASELIGTLIP